MINLLPPEDKKNLHAARRNTIWVRYNLFIVSALIALNIMIGMVALIIQIDKSTINSKVDENNKANSTTTAESARKSIELLKSNLKTAKTLIDNQPPYLINFINFQNAIPKNCSFGSPITVQHLTYGQEYIATLNCDFPTDDPSVNSRASLVTYVGAKMKEGLLFKNPVVTSIKDSDGTDGTGNYILTFQTSSQNPLTSVQSAVPEGCTPKILSALENPKKIVYSCKPLVVKNEAFKDAIYESRSEFDKRVKAYIKNNPTFEGTKTVNIEFSDIPGQKSSEPGEDFSAFLVVDVDNIKVQPS